MPKIKDDSITILAPRTGISSSPLVGYGEVRNLDISSFPGLVKLNKKLAAVTGTITSQINWVIRHPITSTEVYALSLSGVVFKSTNSGATFVAMTGNTQTACHGNGLTIFKNYLIVARDAFLDVCGDGTATGIANANWSNSWKAIDSDVLWHPLYISKNDNKMYGGAAEYVFSLDEDTGETFAPGTASTYTWTQQALDLPSNYRIKCLEELGNNLMCGTWQGTLVNAIKKAIIFPWDRSSVSYGQPIDLNDFGVHAMLIDGNSLIVLAGINGKIRECNGAAAWTIGQIPNSLIDLTGKYLEFYPGALCKYKNKYFFGVGGTVAIAKMGVYSLQKTARGSILNLEHTVSTGNDGTSNLMKINALLPITNERILVGYLDSTTAGMNLTSATAYPTDYSGYFESPLYRVGNIQDMRSFAKLTFQLVNKLATGEGIRLSYRNNLSDSFTLIKTSEGGTLNLLYSVLTAIISHFITPGIPKCELVQIKVELLGNATTSPSFESLILK